MIQDMEDGFILDESSRGGIFLKSLTILCSEIVESQWLWVGVDMIFNLRNILEFQDWENRSKDFLIHDCAGLGWVKDECWLNKLGTLFAFSS